MASPRRLGDHQVAVPVSGGREHPLAACWSASALDAVERAAAEGRLRVRSLLAELDTTRIDASSLDHPESLRNLNTPEDYRAALAEPLPLVTLEPRGSVRAAHLAVGGAERLTLRAGPGAARRRRRRRLR